MWKCYETARISNFLRQSSLTAAAFLFTVRTLKFSANCIEVFGGGKRRLGRKPHKNPPLDSPNIFGAARFLIQLCRREQLKRRQSSIAIESNSYRLKSCSVGVQKNVTIPREIERLNWQPFTLAECFPRLPAYLERLRWSTNIFIWFSE